MSYCLNPSCSKPKNLPNAQVCRTCGSKLLLSDRYQIRKILGKGGFGTTFLSLDLALPGHPCCVIKQLRPTSSDPNVFRMAKELFEREAKTLGSIGNHPQIPRLLDFFECERQFYLVQEFVSGNNLQQEVKRNGPFSEAGIRQFLSEILPLLDYIHGQRVIHRDLKPANLIRREEDRKLVLIDFGAVKNQVNSALAANSTEQTALTAFAVGTAGFAPPEQLAMRPVYASDIYAVGVTCIYLLTGKSPKDIECDTNTGDMAWQKYVHISKHLTGVLQTMLEVSVRNRYKSANEVLEALEMEAYADSLAQNLLTQPVSNQSSQPSPDPANPHSATAKLAMAIRTRRERRSQSSNSNSYSSNTVAFKSTRSSQEKTAVSKKKSFQKRPVEKLDVSDVIKGYRKGRRDFAGQYLRGFDFQRVSLSKCVFHEANLRKTNFQEADLSKVDFGQANLSESILRRANLSRAYLGYANLEGADLRGADLQFAHLKHASLKGANLCGANLANALVTEEQLKLAKLNWSTVLPSGKRSFW